MSIPPARVVQRTGLVWQGVVISLYCRAREGEREGEFVEGKWDISSSHPLHKLTPLSPLFSEREGKYETPQNG